MGVFVNNFGPPAIYMPSRWRSAESPDVVLTPGFFLGSRALLWMAHHLEERGLRCAIPRLGGLLGYMQTRSIQSAGWRMDQYLQSLPPDCRPWLVGHSLGGLISRHAVQLGQSGDRVRGLLTLGTPHRGTPMALGAVAIGVGFVSWAPWQLQPFSRILRRLDRTPWPEQVPLVAVVSSSDLIVRPPRGEPTFLDHRGVRVREFSSIGHTELLWHRDVMDFVADVVCRDLECAGRR